MTVTAVTVPEPGAAGFVLLGVAAIIGGRILRGTIRVARRAAPIVG